MIGDEILAFLAAVDSELTRHAGPGETLELHLLGRSALILGYGVRLMTKDVAIVHGDLKENPTRAQVPAPAGSPSMVDVAIGRGDDASDTSARAQSGRGDASVTEEAAAEKDAARQWATEWLSGVADGSNTMSQRKLTSVEKKGGGVEAIKAVAEEMGVHLLLLEDDKGDELIAASTRPFKVVC